MQWLDDLLNRAFASAASDVVLKTGQPAIFKIQGRMDNVSEEPLNETSVEEVIGHVAGGRFDGKTDLDCSYEVSSGRLRVNIGLSEGGSFIIFRLITAEIPPFSSLGLPSEIMQLAANKRGLVLVTGPVGTGKSTTLAAMINETINKAQRCVVTLEDPIEYRYRRPPNGSLVIQREIGVHVPDFATGLEKALRQNPDIILVGEMRDLPTVETALNATLSGHLVLGTLHTISAVQTIDRLIALFPENRQDDARMQLSLSLKGIVSQALLPRRDGQGRIPCVEILPITTLDIQRFIREGETQKIRQVVDMHKSTGAYPFDSYLFTLVERGLISKQTAMEYAQEPHELFARLLSLPD